MKKKFQKKLFTVIGLNIFSIALFSNSIEIYKPDLNTGITEFNQENYYSANEIFQDIYQTSSSNSFENARAQYYLGIIHLRGLGVQVDTNKSYAFFHQARLDYLDIFSQKKDDPTTHLQSEIISLLFDLGTLDQEGWGTSIDLVQAAKWFFLANDFAYPNEYPQAKKKLDTLLKQLNSKNQEIEKIKEIIALKNRAKLDNENALIVLGKIYFYGEAMIDLPPNYRKTLDYFFKINLSKHPELYSFLGTIYLIGNSIPRDYQTSFLWFQKAAKNGDPTAYYNLGVLYQSELLPNLQLNQVEAQRKAFQWFRAGAEKKHTFSMYQLGLAYLYGKGILKDYGLAEKWLLQAAERKHVFSMCYLAFLYGSKKFLIDYERAKKWAKKGFTLGNTEEKNLCKKFYNDYHLYNY